MCGGDTKLPYYYDRSSGGYQLGDDPGSQTLVKPDTRLNEVDHDAEPTIMFEDFRGISFEQAYNNLVDIIAVWGPKYCTASGVAETGDAVKKGITSATHDFWTGLKELVSSADGWKGATADAAYQNVKASRDIPATISKGADVLGILGDAFVNTMLTTKDYIVSNYDPYRAALQDTPECRDSVKQVYDQFAQKVMTHVYRPNIGQIDKSHPSFATNLPPLGDTNLDLAPGPGLGGAPTLTGGGDGLGSLGAPADPNLTTAMTNAPTDPMLQTPTNPYASGSSPSDLQGLQNMANPLQSALGQAKNAAQNSAAQNSAAQKNANAAGLAGAHGPSKLPREGALGLGPKGLKGGAGAPRGGAGARLPSLRKPSGAPPASATAARTAAAGLRSGLSGTSGTAGVGMPGAGSPAAGHHGGAAAGGQHQPAKMLRRKRNGEILIGDAEAVVAVLGEPARSETAKPEAT